MKKITIPFLLIIYCITSFSKVSVDNLIVYIDPGHGGRDGGADIGDIKEADINLDIAKSLEKVLNSHDIFTSMTRREDKHLGGEKYSKRLDLNERINLINNSDCDMYISIHLNKFSDSIYKGAQTFYYLNNSFNKTLSESIQSSLKVLDNTNHRKAKEIDSLYILKSINKPGCIVECGFMSNPEELEKLLQKEYQLKIAYAIYDGILTALSLNNY